MLRSLFGKNKEIPLNHEQICTIDLARRPDAAGNHRHNFFSQLPPELIDYICTTPNPHPRLEKALHHAIFGELLALQAMLEEARREGEDILKLLLLPTGTTVTPGGLTVKNTTLLECALLAGDPEMVAMIKPYFSKFDGGNEQMERQLTRCKPCIDTMMTQKPEDLTGLFETIKKAPTEDVAEELKTGDQYKKEYQSPLRDALNQWRQAKLNPKNRVIDVLRKPRMFCNYQNWIHVNQFLDTEWDKNQWGDLILNGDNYGRVCLTLRQIRGFIELIDLLAYERFAFANSQIDAPAEQITRSCKYKNSSGYFPNFDSSFVDSHSGLGFDSYASIYGQRAGAGALSAMLGACRWVERFTKFMSNKNFKLAELMPQQQHHRARPSASRCIVG